MPSTSCHAVPSKYWTVRVALVGTGVEAIRVGANESYQVSAARSAGSLMMTVVASVVDCGNGSRWPVSRTTTSSPAVPTIEAGEIFLPTSRSRRRL